MSIIGAYGFHMGKWHDESKPLNNPMNKNHDGLLSQEDRINEQRVQSLGMSKKVTELQEKRIIKVQTLDGRDLLI